MELLFAPDNVTKKLVTNALHLRVNFANVFLKKDLVTFPNTRLEKLAIALEVVGRRTLILTERLLKKSVKNAEKTTRLNVLGKILLNFVATLANKRFFILLKVKTGTILTTGLVLECIERERLIITPTSVLFVKTLTGNCMFITLTKAI